jgi:uncharacterized membrane protein
MAGAFAASGSRPHVAAGQASRRICGEAVGMIRPTRSVLIAAALFACVYVALDFNKLWALRYGADTGNFVQWLVGEAHGRGSWNGAEYRPHLQVHDSWSLLALVPIVWLFPYAQALLVVQVLAVAAGGPALCSFARACGADARSAGFAGIAYLLSPFTQGLAYGNFLENVFVPILAISGAIAARRRALVPALVVAQILLGLKEDEALFLAWFGAACALWWDRRLGLCVVALAGVNGAGFAIAEYVHGAAPSLPHYGFTIDDPLSKLGFFAALLAPFAFAPLWIGRPLLLGAPLVAELTFNRPWAYQIARIGTHWAAPLLAGTAIAAAYAIARRPKLALPALVCAILCALTINDTALKIGRWPYVVDRAAYARAASQRESAQSVVVPRYDEGAYVVAASNPHVVLARYRPGESGYCPAYNTNGRAFFASIGFGNWPSGTTLCGGVALTTRR